MSYKSDGLLNYVSNIQGINTDITKRLIVDFIIAAGDTVSLYKLKYSLSNYLLFIYFFLLR